MIFLESLMPVNCQFHARFFSSFMPVLFVTVSWKFFEKNLCPFLLQFLPVFMPDFCHFFASIFCHNAGQFLARSGNFPGTLPENCQIWHKLLQGIASKQISLSNFLRSDMLAAIATSSKITFNLLKKRNYQHKNGIKSLSELCEHKRVFYMEKMESFSSTPREIVRENDYRHYLLYLLMTFGSLKF